MRSELHRVLGHELQWSEISEPPWGSPSECPEGPAAPSSRVLPDHYMPAHAGVDQVGAYAQAESDMAPQSTSEEQSMATQSKFGTEHDRAAAASALQQGIEKRFCRFQVGRVEAFGKAIVHGLKQRERLCRAALFVP